jgi:probable F420-dependent oxidoreductase
MPRLGVELAGDLSLAEKLDLCAWADSHGFDDAWMAEITDPDAFATLGAAAVGSSRIRFGTAIVPLGTRSVPVLAAGAATLSELAPGRFALGVGVSSTVVVEHWNGMHRGRPLGRARESIALLRALLAGERADFQGEFVRSSGFKLRHPPSHEPPIVLAALNIKMLELAGEIADGVFLNFVPATAMSAVLEAVARGAERGGRPALPEILLSLQMEVTDEPEVARRKFADELTFYLSVPPYQKALAWYGLAAEVERAKEAWKTGRRADVAAAISNELVDQLGIFGSPEQCRARVETYWKAGVDSVTICPPSVDYESTLRHFAAA